MVVPSIHLAGPSGPGSGCDAPAEPKHFFQYMSHSRFSCAGARTRIYRRPLFIICVLFILPPPKIVFELTLWRKRHGRRLKCCRLHLHSTRLCALKYGRQGMCLLSNIMWKQFLNFFCDFRKFRDARFHILCKKLAVVLRKQLDHFLQIFRCGVICIVKGIIFVPSNNICIDSLVIRFKIVWILYFIAFFVPNIFILVAIERLDVLSVFLKKELLKSITGFSKSRVLTPTFRIDRIRKMDEFFKSFFLLLNIQLLYIMFAVWASILMIAIIEILPDTTVTDLLIHV